jgi:hypothetical protein
VTRIERKLQRVDDASRQAICEGVATVDEEIAQGRGQCDYWHEMTTVRTLFAPKVSTEFLE